MKQFGNIRVLFHRGFWSDRPVCPVPQVRVRPLDANLGSGHKIDHTTLADAMHFLKLSFAKRLRGPSNIANSLGVSPGDN
jgi:hypothetical protein